MAKTESPWSQEVTFRTTAGGTEPPIVPPPGGGEGIDGADIAGIVAAGGRHYDFEGGTNGQSVTSAYPTINGATDGTISTEEAAHGTKSFKTFIDPKDGGYGSYGGILGEVNPKHPFMLQGGEVWVRWYSFKPQSWENECDPYMKHMRISTVTSSGDNSGGYSDMYLNGHQHRWITETDQDWWEDPWYKASSAFNLRKGVWECYELYTRMGHTPTKDGGNGLMRFWVNGVLAIETGNRRTMKDAGGRSDRVLWHTWHQYNNGQGGGATQRRNSYMDQWTLAFRGNEDGGGSIDCTGSMATDAQGNYMIGTARA